MNFYISAAHKSSGKTTISIGLSAALTHLNYQVETFKKGPDYIDPIWLQQAAQNPCFNLDFYTMSHQEITKQFEQPFADFKLIEGNKGLYDGLDKNGTDSNAALANLLNTPVILVIDCVGITRGIAPLLLGYQQFNQPPVNIKGVILNKVGGLRHQQKLINATEYYTDIPVIGSVFNNKEIIINERHLGLIPSNELQQTEALIIKMRDVILDSVNLNFFKPDKKVDYDFTPPKPLKPLNTFKSSDLKIAIAKDAAFGFYYANDLQKFKELGAEIIFFSPLNDKKLPDNINGLFLGGGFPETHAKQLTNNQSLLNDLQQKIINGLPTYAECGGMMILTKSITYQDKKYKMAGVINADCVMSQKPVGRGYVNIKTTEQHPWQLPKQTIKAHEFHYSTLKNIANDTFAYQVKRGNGIFDKKDGIVVFNLLANYTHLKHSKSLPWVDYFLRFCASKK